MGYKAPSAEDVYRYAFRLDHTNRSLTDGFGFSIIFVNDDSPICREFISRYFVDLCHRTADRIRIIFFSNLPQSYFEAIANEINRGVRLREGGMLGEVIKLDSYRSSECPETKLLDHFYIALHLQSYDEIDLLLSGISHAYGPQFAHAFYRLVLRHRNEDSREAEIEVRELIIELKERGRRSSQDLFGSRYYDHQWRDLTPASLAPIESPERTRELSYEIKTNSAMPGVAESMLFAARLGIGRLVPCFVFFTDVGELSVDIFSVEGLSASETYDKLKKWIDGFYEENRDTINKWNQLESDIAIYSSSVNKTLASLRNWINQSERLWEELRSTAQLIVKLSAALPKPEIYKSVIDGLKPSSWKWSWECRRILSECQARLTDLATKKANHDSKQRHLDKIINMLNAASNFADVYYVFDHISRDPITPSELMDSNGVLHQAMNEMGACLYIDPENELFVWWRHVQENMPSLKQFKRYRRKWYYLNTIKDPYPGSEYKALLDGIFTYQFSDTAEIQIEKTRTLIENIVGIDPQSSDWNTAYLEYSYKLTPFFHQLYNNAPDWIDKSATDLKISQVIPFRTRNPVDFKYTLAVSQEASVLRRMIANVTFERSKLQAELTEKRDKEALQYRDDVLATFVKLREEQLDILTEEVAAYSACLSGIRDLRDGIEKKLIDLANSSDNHDNLPYAVNNSDIDLFLSLLDEYDYTVNNLIYPYKHDGKVKSVKLSAPVPQILKLGISENTKPSDLKRKELEEITRDSKTGPILLQDVQNRSCTLTPKARLVHELIKKGVIQEFADKQEPSAFGTIENLEETLNRLNDYELYSVWNSLMESTVIIESRKAIIDMILTITGKIPTQEQSRNIANKLTGEDQLQNWPTWMDEVLNSSGSKPRLDVGIVIAMEEEFKELAPQIKTRPYYNSDLKQYYYLFERNVANGTIAPYRCVVTFMGTMGPTDAGIVSDRLIAQFNPALIVSIGIAGSMGEDVLVGNVVVADQTDEYLATSKAIETEDKRGWDIRFSSNTYKSDPEYVSHANNLIHAHQDVARDWQELGKQKLQEWIGLDSTEKLICQRLIGDVPEIHTGHIASGPIVGGSNQFVNWLRENHDRKLLALEMESVGVLNAAHKRGVSSLIIRGISDYSDERKVEMDKIGKGALRRYAMNNALRLLWVLMDLQLINRNN